MIKIHQKIGILFILIMALILTDKASATLITADVSGETNLYYDDWGHLYNDTDVSPQGEYNALGTGINVSAVPYVFSSGQTINITASGCVVDSGLSCTDPNGSSWTWRGLPVFSLIGIWSSDSSSVNPVEGGYNPAFFIGSSASLVAPTATDDLYLFIGENDGIYTDNPGSYSYSVSIEVAKAPVPEPSTLLLLGSGIIGLFIFKNKLRKK